ncbi:MAG TPA: hypothetical protein PKE30_19950 [Niabella sp.]|nr:hypothetical protein [Niabella sp.]
MLPVIHIPHDLVLPDTDQWQFRFQIQSETSDRIYVISQHKKKKHWGCSCMAWKRYRHCKHLKALGLPDFEQPYEVNFIKD